MSNEDLASRYPKTITLPGGEKIELRLMTGDDASAILRFAQALPTEDLLFLRVDLTQQVVIEDWVSNIENGHSTSIVAYEGDDLIGYATVHRNNAPWARRVGELRVNVSQAYRARSLGKTLISEIFDVARGLGMRKLMANMTADQKGAQAAFRKLGFIPEALLADYVEDRNGTSRDLVIMSHDVDGHTDQMADVALI